MRVAFIWDKADLHYALDLWFERVVKPRCKGEVCLIRYADDYVCAFEYQEDAERFYTVLGQRLRKFGLELAAEKTRVIAFSRHLPESTSFEFLGFEFRWGRDRSGRPHVKRRTSRKKLRSSIKRMSEWCRENRHVKVSEQFARLNAKLRGYYNYYGVHGNAASLSYYFHAVTQTHLKWLNRRGQRKSYTWVGYKEALKHYKVELPRIVGRPKTKLATTMA